MKLFAFAKSGRALLVATAVAAGGLSGCMIVADDKDDTGGNATAGNSHTHTWSDWVVTTKPTCNAQGVETRTCTQNANHHETRAVARLTGAACNPTGGWGDHVHTWGAWTVLSPATCSASGVEIRTCTQDASHNETNTIPQLTGAACNSGGGGSYEFVTIGGQKWMKKNLNIQTADSWCYGEGGQELIGYDDDDNPILQTLSSSEIQANCNKYGRLYTWEAAKKACPRGWHLPSRDEWDHLAESVGGSKSSNYETSHDWLGAGKKLKSTSGWYNDANGTDDFEFSALPGAYRTLDGNFNFIGYRGAWWTATERVDNKAYDRGILYINANVYEGYNNKNFGESVRCVMDE